MRLVDADWIHQNSDERFPGKKPYQEAWGLTMVDSAPTIDAVPVVRCRECKRWDPDPDSYGKDDGPKGKCMKSFEETYDDDFCSYGQRKEAAHD